METGDRARELAAKLQMERDLATFPDRPLQVFAICSLGTMSEIHEFLYELAGLAVIKPTTIKPTYVTEGEVVSEPPVALVKKRRVIKHRKKATSAS